MAFHVRDPETDALVRELALKRGVGLTDAVKQAVSAELRRERDEEAERDRRIDAIIDRVANAPRTGLEADKAFFDELSGD